jgi:cation:H+ antiporter
MLTALAAIAGGLALLAFGAHKFVDGAAATARNSGVSPLLVGLIIVGFATSAPELLVAAVAALQGNPALGIGNAVGSNIANIGLVLGVTALVKPLIIQSGVLRREFPMMFVAMLFALALMWDLHLSVMDGLALAAAMALVIMALARLGRHAQRGDRLTVEFEQELQVKYSTAIALLWVAGGLMILLLGSHLLVWGAVSVAEKFGVSDLVIGLTIVAVGTSLPELAAAVVSAYKGEPEIALGNVIGSNMFNILGVICLPAIIHPTSFGQLVLSRDMLVMFILSAALFLMASRTTRPGHISRLEGAVLITAFWVYQWSIFATSPHGP